MDFSKNLLFYLPPLSHSRELLLLVVEKRSIKSLVSIGISS